MNFSSRRPRDLLPKVVANSRMPLMVLAIYLILAIIMTWPLIAKLGTHIPGAGRDAWVHLWTFHWVKTALANGLNPFYTDLLYYPTGVSLTTHNIAWVNIAFWLPLQALVGEFPAQSLLYILIFALNGLAMFLLIREWTLTVPAAFVGGLIFAFWPAIMSRSSHPNLIVVLFLPLTLLFLRRTVREGRILNAILAGLFIGLIGLTRWQLLILAIPMIAIYLLYECLANKSKLTWRLSGLLLLSALVAILITAPLATPVIVAQLNQTNPQEIFEGLRQFQSDLVAFIVPSARLRLWGTVAQHLPSDIRFIATNVEFIGYATLALVAVAIIKMWRIARLWVLLATVYIILALGPELKLGSNIVTIVPMPYQLIEDLYIVRLIRDPQRFNIFLALPISMLAAIGVSALLNLSVFSKRAAVLAAGLGAIILAEYALVPYATREHEVPEWYQQLAQEPGRFAVLDLPMRPTSFDKQYMMYQLTHGKSLMEGHVSRRTGETYAYLDGNPFLKELRRSNEMDPELKDVSQQLQQLADDNVRYVILHKDLTSADQIQTWQEWLVVEPFYQDEDLIVYRTNPHLGEDFNVTHRLIEEIGIIETDFAPRMATQGGIILADTVFAGMSAPSIDYDACLILVNRVGKVAQRECQSLSPGWPTSYWTMNEVVRDDLTINVDPFLEEGTYSLELILSADYEDDAIGESAKLGDLEIEALERTFGKPDPMYPMNTTWADLIRLTGFDLQEASEWMQLTLFWQANQRIEKSYKVFVHLIDQNSGRVVVQDDAVPRGWTYPTNWWESDEIVKDTITLQLDGVPAGDYRLMVGLYDPATGERLMAFTDEIEPVRDNAVELTTVDISP